MHLSLGFLLTALLVCCAGHSSAADIRGRAYDINQNPIPNREFGLLFKSSYTVRDDGTVWAPGASQPVTTADMPYVLEKLVRNQRLKTLLTLNLILSRSKGEKKLTPEERESIRAIVRDNWFFLTYDTRKDFKSYFNRDELDEMNAASPLPRAHLAQGLFEEAEEPEEAASEPLTSAVGEPLERVPRPAAVDPNTPEPPVLDLTRPLSETPAATPPPAPALPVAALPPAALVSPPLMTPLALRQAPAPATPAPVPASPTPPTPTPTPTPQPAAQPAPPPPGAGAISGIPARMTPEEFARLTRPSQPQPAPKIAQPPPPPPAPEIRTHAQVEQSQTALVAAVPPEQFDKFLADAPYSRQVRAILKIVSDNAPPFARDRTLSLVMTVLPNIVIDPSRTGRGVRAGFEEVPGRPASIVLSPNPVVFEESRLFFKGSEVLLTQSADAYRDLGLPAPTLGAMNRESSSEKTTRSDWGESLIFEDGSRRGTFTPEQQAGTLLALLIHMDLDRRGQNAEPFTTELFTRTGQMMLYSKIDRSLGTDEFLDRETRATYRQWVQNPSEFRDHVLHTLSAGLAGVIDPRQAGVAGVERSARAALAACKGGAPGAGPSPADSRRHQARALKSTGIIDSKRLDEALAFIDRNPSSSSRTQPAGSPDAASGGCGALEKKLSDLQRSRLVAEELLGAEKRFRAGGGP